METTLYELLDVAPDATSDEIKAAYRKLARQVHPDAGGNAALFRQVQDAFETLSEPTRRAAYDESLRSGAAGCGADDEPEPEPEPEPEQRFDPEDDPEWTVVDDGSGEEPFEEPFDPTGPEEVATWQEVPRSGLALGNLDLETRTRLVGALCGVLVACAWIWQASFALGPAVWAGELPLFAIVLAGVGALATPRMLRRRGTAGAIRFATLLALAPVLIAGLLLISIVGGVFAKETKKRR